MNSNIEPSISLVAIAGGVVGGLVAFVLVILLLLLIIKSRTKAFGICMHNHYDAITNVA